MVLIHMDLQDLSMGWFVFLDELREHLTDKKLLRGVIISLMYSQILPSSKHVCAHTECLPFESKPHYTGCFENTVN